MRKNSYDKSVIVAAILSINDGLVSNFLLMMTVAGSSMSIKNILITGISGVLAGAISMGVGTWRAVSVTQKKVRSSKELITSLTDNVDDTTVPIVLNTGKSPIKVTQKQKVGGVKEVAKASIASFIAFTIGSSIPVIPFICFDGTDAIVISAVLSLNSLFTIGVLSSLKNRPIVSGLKQVFCGVCVAALTYGLGYLFGTS